uniref:hypothetical protein n=1 Tax=Actinomadura sp. CA-154981 TaxID=3240037 RepID=UPI003F49069B
MNGTDQVIAAVLGSLHERAQMARTAVDNGAEGLSQRPSAGRGALEALDQALVHLDYGKEGRHLLGTGWGEVVRVTRGEV